MTTRKLITGDPFAPQYSDLIVEIFRLKVGAPVPDGWRLNMDGNLTTSEITRVVTRGELWSDFSVVVSPFVTTEDGDQTHAEDGDEQDGWCVYVRVETPYDPEQPFDITYDENFEDYDDAVLTARRLACIHLGNTEAWEEI